MKKIFLTFLLALLCYNVYSKGNPKDELDRQLLIELRNIECSQDKNETLKAFLQNKLNHDDNNANITMLMLASAIGDIEAVKYLTKNNLSEESIKEFPKIAWAYNKLWKNDKTIKEQEQAYIRHRSRTGYTALTFAVVGGNHQVVEYLLTSLYDLFVLNIKKAYSDNSSYSKQDVYEKSIRTANELTAFFVNREDNNGWNSMGYAVSFIPYCDEEQEIQERIKILSTLIHYGGKNTKVNIIEGERDIIGLSSRYGNYRLISYLHKLYNEMYKNPLLKKAAEERFGTKDEVRESIEISLIDTNRILDNEIIIDGNNVQEHLLYYEKTINELNEWLKDL